MARRRHSKRSYSRLIGLRTHLAVLGGIGSVLLGFASSANANPDVQSKREQATAILAEVRELDAEVGAAAERWNGANLRLASLDAELRSTRVDLRRARSGLGVASKRASTRLVELYVSGAQPAAIEIILGARSLRELIDALDAQDRIAQQDAWIVGELRRYRARVAARERRLETARAEQVTVVEQLATERAAIEAKLAERQELLASVQAEVRRLEAAERARQEELRRRARDELARLRRLAATTAGLSPEAETPVGSAQEESALSAGDPAATPAGPAPPADAGRGAQVVAIAMQYLGVPYKWGGASPSTGFDCSGFTMYVFAQIGVSLPHYAAAQYGMGAAVSSEELQPGDLVFFRGLGHMGMYIGGGSFIHAPHTGDVVKISSLSEPNYVSNWVGARRVL